MAGPLEGVRVLEAANFVSGPYAGMLLADLGTEVWKVEKTAGGDPFRKWGGPGEAMLPQFAAYNRGKRSLALDITTTEGQTAFRRLAKVCDVLIENFRPGKLDRLGLGYEDLAPLNPRLIYCSITGVGATGPRATLPYYDSIGLALSGLWSRFVSLEQPRPIGPQVGDQLTSLYAVIGILAALAYREQHGKGQRVEVNMLLSNMAFIPEPIANYLALAEIGDVDTRPSRSQAYALIAQDGLPLTVHLSSVPKFWEGLTRAIERPDLLIDSRFSTRAGRVEHYAQLRDELSAVFLRRGRDEWLSRLAAEDVPSAPINSLPEAVKDPQSRHLNAIHTYGDGDRAIELIRCPVDYTVTNVSDGGPPPELGEHSSEILLSVGYSKAEIEGMRGRGVVFESESAQRR